MLPAGGLLRSVVPQGYSSAKPINFYRRYGKNIERCRSVIRQLAVNRRRRKPPAGENLSIGMYNLILYTTPKSHKLLIFPATAIRHQGNIYHCCCNCFCNPHNEYPLLFSTPFL